MGYDLIRPGDVVQELLEASAGNEDCLAYNIKTNPEHFICAIAAAIPWFTLFRVRKACEAWEMEDAFFAYFPND